MTAEPTRLAVTGGTGFVGRHLVRFLLERGADTAVLARSPATSATELERLGARVVLGDLASSEALADCFRDAEIVFHLAGRVTDWGPRSAFEEANVEGTRRVLEAAVTAGVQRVVHASSATVYGYHRPHHGTEEQADLASIITENYTWSKIEAERVCREWIARPGRPEVVIARIGWVWGPEDTTILPRLLEFLLSPAFAYLGDGRNVIDLVYVRNLVEALWLLARHSAAADETFNLNDGQRMTSMRFFEALCEALGERVPPRRFFPRRLAYGVGAVCEAVGKILRLENPPPLTRYAVDSLFNHLDFSVEKARRALGWQPSVAFEEGLARTAAWWQAQGRAVRP